MSNTRNLSAWIYQKRKTLCAVAVLAYMASVSGVYFAEFEADFRLFFPKNSLLIQTFDDISDRYEQGDSLALYVKFPAQKALNFDSLAVIERADALMNTLPYTRSVRSLASFQKPFSSDDELVNKFISEWGDELKANGDDFQPIEQYINQQRQLKGGLVANHGAGALVLAQLDLTRPIHASSGEAMAAAEEIVTQLEAEFPSIKVYISGSVAFDRGLFTEFVNFLLFTFPMVLVLVSLAVVWVSGSVWITLAGLTASGFTLAATAGIFGWLPVALDQIAITATLLVMVLTVVDCIHLGATYVVGIQNGLSKEEALIESIRMNLKPIFFTTLTTSIGFIALLFTGSPPFILFAFIALVGIIIGFIFSFIFMTALCSWFPVPDANKVLPTDALVKSVRGLVMRYPKSIVLTFSVLTLISFVGISQNVIDEDPSNYFTSNNSLDHAIEAVRSDFTVANSLSVTVRPYDDTVVSPAVFFAIDEFETWLQGQRGHINTVTVNDIIKEIKQVWGSDGGNSTLPTSSAEFGQYLLIYQMSLLQGQSSDEIIAADRSETLVSVFLEDYRNKELIELETDIHSWWREHYPSITIETSGRDLIFAHLAEQTVRQAIVGAGLAAALITVLMILTFRSLKWGLFSLVPNALPFIFLFGVWGAFYGEISQATCMAFTIVLGVVVDDSIHFIFKFRDNKKVMALDDALAKTYQFVGYAISATTVAFIVNGLVLYFTSGFVANAVLGAVMVLILIAAWLCDLLLMPALLVLYYRRQEQRSKQALGLSEEGAAEYS